MVVGNNISNDGFLVRILHSNVLGVEQGGEAKLFLGDVECIVEVEDVVALLKLVETDDVRSGRKEIEMSGGSKGRKMV